MWPERISHKEAVAEMEDGTKGGRTRGRGATSCLWDSEDSHGWMLRETGELSRDFPFWGKGQEAWVTGNSMECSEGRGGRGERRERPGQIAGHLSRVHLSELSFFTLSILRSFPCGT